MPEKITRETLEVVATVRHHRGEIEILIIKPYFTYEEAGRLASMIQRAIQGPDEVLAENERREQGMRDRAETNLPRGGFPAG